MYAFTSPMGRTACTEPQSLYKGTLFTIILVIFYEGLNTFVITVAEKVVKVLVMSIKNQE
jgi:hypothetical protein